MISRRPELQLPHSYFKYSGAPAPEEIIPAFVQFVEVKALP
jgi:hypothetical protein